MARTLRSVRSRVLCFMDIPPEETVGKNRFLPCSEQAVVALHQLAVDGKTLLQAGQRGCACRD